MDHVAIMKKFWKLIDKILSGEKTVESRWYMAKFALWNRIQSGDSIYFKDAGCPVTARAEVEKVLQYSNFSHADLKDLIKKYAGSGKICFVSSPNDVYEWAKNKRYCILIFLKNSQKITPFEIDKTGFGNSCAWICVKDINKIKCT